VAAVSDRDDQVLVTDMLTITKFKTWAKLFLNKGFPSYKEFSALFPFAAHSTYYMWRWVIYEGLVLVDG
jgi:hypothetical protein